MWYLIADANAISDTSLRVGQTLLIPNQVATIRNNAGTFEPYNAGKFTGDTMPTVPGPAAWQPSQCQQVGVMVAAVVASIVIAAAATAATVFTLGTAAVAAYPAAAILISALIGAAAGAAASMASQGIMIAGRLQAEMDWKEVGYAALSGFITSGVSSGAGVLARNALNVAKMAESATKYAKLAKMMVTVSGASMKTITAAKGGAARFVQAGALIGRVGSAAAVDAAADATSQGIGIALGLRKNFDWAEVTTAAIGGATAAGDPLPDAEKFVLKNAVPKTRGLLGTVAIKAGVSSLLAASANLVEQSKDEKNGIDWKEFGLVTAGAAAGGVVTGIGTKYLSPQSKLLAFGRIAAGSLGSAMGIALTTEPGSQLSEKMNKLLQRTFITSLTVGFSHVGRLSSATKAYNRQKMEVMVAGRRDAIIRKKIAEIKDEAQFARIQQNAVISRNAELASLRGQGISTEILGKRHLLGLEDVYAARNPDIQTANLSNGLSISRMPEPSVMDTPW